MTSLPNLPFARTTLLPALVAALVLPGVADGQSWKDRLKAAAVRGATEAATRKAEGAASKGTEKTIDAAAGAVAGTIGLGGGKAGASGEVSASGAPQADATPAAASLDEAWANYDFVPGTRPLFVDDFSTAPVGDFPKRLTWEKGNFEVVDYQSARWLRATSFGWFAIPLPEVLPERFTLELQMIAPGGWAQHIIFGPRARGDGQTRVSMAPDRGGVYIDGESTVSAPPRPFDNRPIPVRVMADGQHVKVYMGETRVANIPQIDLGRDRAIRFGISADATHPVLIGQVRVMAGGRDLYDALADSGRVATQGIRFMTNSDALLQESMPTLKTIAAMLADHPELTLTIEGHTDDVGNAGSNQTLSEERAAAVKAALVDRYGVSADRLTTAGFGATRPARPNTTSEGRAANRRVELVKN